MNDICNKCRRDCDSVCEALFELKRIYSETKTKEKQRIIKNLRSLLNICDAEPSEELTNLATRIIDKFPEMHFIRDFDIKVGYVMSYECKKDTLGDCRKVNTLYSAYLPFDFIITFYEPNIAHMSENQLKLLMYHELKHIGIGDRGFIVVPHDIEDFFDIIDFHGNRWSEFDTEVIDILG